MLPEAGHFALILALLVALLQATLPLVGAARGRRDWMAVAPAAARAQALLVAIAFGCLASAFLGNDFSVLNVATNSNTELPAHYRFAATWGSHEGSLLLWVLLLAVWTVAVTFASRGLPQAMVARVLAVMGALTAAFLAFMLLTSNPFDRLYPPALEGRDLNPLLQDPAMVLHPPLLYMGYVGFSVAYAFAMAALIGGRLDAQWARWSRPWTTLAWCFLTLGIAVGSWWAYHELGWGGWWFWDPVENASLMPWLVGTALVHSLAVTDRRDAFRRWTVVLAVVAFALSLLGTFLVRSGVLSSVHAFATDPRRGVFILGFLVLVVGVSVALVAWRSPRVAAGNTFGPVSRESALLANNALLVVAASTVLLGTLYPLLLDALGAAKVSVGPPYFEAVMVPIFLPLLLLMGAGPFLRWRQASAAEVAKELRWALAVSIAAALAIPLVAGNWTAMKSLGLFCGAWIVTASLAGARALLRRPARPGRAQWGMLLAHGGLGVLVVGVTVVRGYELERDVPMRPGATHRLGTLDFTFVGTEPVEGPNFRATRATIELSRAGERIAVLAPEKRRYHAQPVPMTEAAVHRTLARDVYVSLGEPLADGGWSVRLQNKPLVGWIWGGAFLMAIGGLVALSDRRYRSSAQVARGDLAPARESRD